MPINVYKGKGFTVRAVRNILYAPLHYYALAPYVEALSDDAV